MICDYQSVECRYTFSEFLAFSYSSSYNLAPPITGRPEKVTIRKRRKKQVQSFFDLNTNAKKERDHFEQLTSSKKQCNFD